MSDILVKWLNEDLELSTKVGIHSFASDFSSGYLIGEVLAKNQLQDDFDDFSQSKTADSKLNNFTRIEPTLHLLGIPFDTNNAREVMTEKYGIATRLMYQLFIALNNKKKANLTGAAIETMRAAAPVKLEKVESIMYKDRLKQETPRQTDLNLDALVARFHSKQIEMEKVAFKERLSEQERIRKQQQDYRKSLLERTRFQKHQQSELLAKIEAAIVEIPKMPPNRTSQAIKMRKQLALQKEAEQSRTSIWEFEEKRKNVIPESAPIAPDQKEGGDGASVQKASPKRRGKTQEADPLDLIKPASNDEYIGAIRKRLHEDQFARVEREKRRRKVLVDQLKAHETQEEAKREEMLVNRLMRQSQQERRIAVQLLQARHEKEVIRNNRAYQEKQFEERRERDFIDALEREAEMAKLVREEYAEQTKLDKELHDKIAEDRAQAKYKKHYDACMAIIGQVVDFACRVGDYREFTEQLVPQKIFREWTNLFIEGKPLYDVIDEEPIELSPAEVLANERDLVLNEGDFREYREMVGEWVPPEGSNVTGPPRNNPIVGHVVKRLFDMVHPPSPPPPVPEFPPFPIKACVLGKAFSGKTTCCKLLARSHRLTVLNSEELLAQAIAAHNTGEVEEYFEEVPIPITPEADLPGTGAPTPNTAAGTNPNTPVADEADGKQSSQSAVDSNKIQEEKDKQTPVDNGAEKSDAEKPVDETESQKERDIESARTEEVKTPEPKYRPTLRAELGHKAIKCLRKGKALDDQIIVDIIAEAIRELPEGTGWILDSFPSTYAQSKLLEKALTGNDANVIPGKQKKKSIIAPDPKPAPPPPELKSGLNVVIYFDIENDLCLKRSAGRSEMVQNDEQFQMEFNPPPEGSITGVGDKEKVVPVTDPDNDQEQIQHRITGFLDNWTKIEKWYNKFGILRKVDASLETDILYLEVENVLEETLAKIRGEEEKEEVPVEPPQTEQAKVEEPNLEETEPTKTPEPPKTPPEEGKRSRPGSKGSKKSGSRSGSAKSSRSKSPKSDKKGGKGSKSASPKRDAKSPKRSDSGKSPKRGRSPKGSPKRKGSGKKGKTPEVEPEPEVPEEPQGPPPPEPGSEEWEYFDQDIEFELAKVLALQWENIENSYIDNSKFVFSNLRGERENIIQYFYDCRKEFVEFLRRPDHKQEFVSAWQLEHNSIPDDLREDEETRGESHQRVDDVRERLWSICDERKEQAEEERVRVMGDGWLDDRMGILTNHFVTQMQAELDRLHDTNRLLKDYYRGMEGHIPDELKEEHARLPLLEIPVTERQLGSAKSGTDAGSRAESLSPTRSETRKSATPSGKKKGKEEKPPEPENEEGKPKIPLVPRRPISPDPNAAKKDSKKKKGPDDPESPVPPEDPDEKLIFNSYWTAWMSVHNAVVAAKVAKEAEEEAERLAEAEREKEKNAAALAAAAGAKKGGKGKGGKKSRSPSPKKKKDADKPTPAATPAPEDEMSPEELLKKKIKENTRQEAFFALNEDAQACKTRLELIQLHACAIIQDLKAKADTTFKDMNDWIGARFLKEIESIDHMSEIMRYHIESGTKIDYELVLSQEDFIFNQDVKVVKTPSPTPPPEPREIPAAETFTISQLDNLYKHFVLIAPNGVMSSKTFIDTIMDLTNVSHGMEMLPETWLSITQNQLQEITSMISPDSEYVDWKAFLIAACQLPVPTQTELLEVLSRYKELDQMNTGTVTREQFQRVKFWFEDQTETDNTEEGFDRLAALRREFFDFFADHTSSPPRLNYIETLMYFAADPDPYNGFLRALSVSSEAHMPRIRIDKKEDVDKKEDADKKEDQDKTEDVDKKDDEESAPVEENIPADIPESAIDAKVPLDALLKVFHHGERDRGDSHRFAVSQDPEDAFSRERLAGVYQELGNENLEPLKYTVLKEHPIVQDLLTGFNRFKAPDLGSIFHAATDNTDAQSTKTGD